MRLRGNGANRVTVSSCGPGVHPRGRAGRIGEKYVGSTDGLGSTFAPETMRDVFGVEGSYPDEARLAYEQWLRRIPDDPGGLLRRKFALEYRSRGANAPISNELW